MRKYIYFSEGVMPKRKLQISQQSLLEQISIPIYFITFLEDQEIYMLVCSSLTLQLLFSNHYKKINTKNKISSTMKFYENIFKRCYISEFHQTIYQDLKFNKDDEFKCQMLWELVRTQWEHMETNYLCFTPLYTAIKFICICTENTLTTEYVMKNNINGKKCSIGTTCIKKFHPTANKDLYKAKKKSENLSTHCIGCYDLKYADENTLPKNIKRIDTLKENLKNKFSDSQGYISIIDLKNITCELCIPTTLCTICELLYVYKINININNQTYLNVYGFYIDYECTICEICSKDPNCIKRKQWIINKKCIECGSNKNPDFKTCFTCFNYSRHKCQKCQKLIDKKYKTCYACKYY